MTIRKRNDDRGYERGAKGIDGNMGSNFTKRGGDSWDSNPRGNFVSPKGAGAYQGSDSGLRNKLPDEDSEQGKYTLAGGARDIFDAVENQSSDSGNRAVKSGRTD
jgi:hypothetical protein